METFQKLYNLHRREVIRIISIIVVSHSALAEALVKAAEMILGKQEELFAVGLDECDSPDSLKTKILELLNNIPETSEILVFTDIQSGTPFNIVALLSQKYKFSHISGVNLPLLLEACTSRNYLSLEDLSKNLMEMSSQSIINVNELFS